jgi:UDP-glucose 4-epimerase
VREVIDSVKRVSGVDFTVVEADRRPGDPPQLYANADKVKAELGWEAKITDIDQIVASAWNWFKAHPNGYDD